MADGNLGDLWFQLGVKDNTSKELQKIIDKLKTGDDAANALLRALQGFGTKKSGFKEQAEKAKEFADVLNEINRRISKLKKNDKGDEAKDLQLAVKNALSYLNMLQRINIERSKISELRSLNPNVDTSKLREAELMLENVNNQLFRLQNKAQGGGGGGVDGANVLQEYAKVLQMTFRDVKQITDQFKKENPLSAFSGGAAKVEADIARVTEKLARMRDLMAEGVLRGYNTNMLGGSITELDKILARLQSASGNKSLLTDAAQMKNLLSDVAVEMTKATAATQAYGREKGKTIALERAAAEVYDRQKRQKDAAKKAQDEELKNMSNYIKRYMALVEKRREIAEKAGISPFFKNDQGLKNIKAEIDSLFARLGKVREDITLYQHAIGTGTKEGISFGQQGLKEANAEAEKLMGTITALQNVYDTLRVSQANVKDLIGQTPQKQRQDDIQKKMSEYYSNLEKTSAKQAAQATRDAAKAKREDIAAEKQRQNELKNTERRYDSLGNKVRQLRSEYSRGISIGADVSKAEAEIKRLLSIMRALMSIRDRLNSENWRDYVGALGSIGSGHDTTLASRVLQDQRAVNREVQRGVELEQKRQQEIAQSAARARNDLAAAFAGANAEAKKMQSIMGDIKSLFLQGGIVFGAQQLFNSIVHTGGEIVQQHVALRSILGDVQKADKLFEQTQQLALQSPFKFGELNRDVKQLAAFGVEANDLYETTKRLADIASGLGIDFGRLGLAFGQVKARSWLDGKELRQFAYAGLPLLQKITDLYNSEGKNGRTNYTNSDIKKMISNREVSFEDVQKVLWKLTDEGGQFYNMQFVLSETLLGKWNKLIDAWDIMLGKFADGKNIIGSTFKVFIDGVTSLVLAIDKMSPALLAVGAMFALRKGVGAIGSKVGIASNIAMYQAELQAKLRTYAVEQQRLLIEGKITQEQFSQRIADQQGLLNSRMTLRNSVEQAALEGKLGAMKLQKAYREKLITAEMIRQLELMGIISAKQSELIMKDGMRARMSLGVNQLKGKIGGFFTGWNLATLGISVAMGLYSGYKQFKDKIKQEADRINETAKTNFKNMSELLSEVGYKGSTGEVLQKQIDKMKDVLEQSGLYTESIKEQVARAQDLSEEYDILKKKVSEVKEASNIDKGEAMMYAEAKKATGAGFAGGASWFGQWTGVGQDDIDENTNDVAENLAKLQIKMEKLGDSTKSSMEKVADSMLGAKAAGMTFEEKLYTLYKTGGNGAATWRSFVEKVSRGNGDMRESLENLEGDLRYFGANFKELTTDDIPKYLKYLAKERNMSLDEFSKWCKAHPQKLETMLDQMLSTANEKVPDLVERLRSVALAILNIGETQPKSNKPKVWKNPLKEGTVERTTFNNLQKRGKLRGGKDGFWQKEMAEFISTLNHGSSGGWFDFGEAVRKKYQDVRNENDSARSAGQKEPFLRQQRMLEAIAGQNGIDLNVGKNKVTGNYGKGSQEDIELERLRKRVELYKKFYSELEKYRRIYGEEGAMIQMRSDKEFRNSVLSWGLSDPGTYGVSIEELMSHVPSSTQKRKEYKEGLLADIHAKNRSAEEERIKSENNQLSKQLNIISEQYETYKKIYELTGNRDGSSLLAFGHVQSGTYQEYLKDQMSWAVGDHNKRTGQNLSAEDVLNMNESDFNKNIGNESENASVIYKAWVEETKRIKKETIDLMASLIEKNATIAQQIEDENRKYERQLELIKGIEDPQMRDRAKAGATKTHNENVAKLQFEQFKQESDWVTIFDDLDGVSTSTIDNMITKIDEFSRTTGLSVESIKQLRDALEKLKAEQIERNPLPYIFGAVKDGNAIGNYLKGKLGAQYMNGKKYVPTAEQAKNMGIKFSKDGYTKDELGNMQKGKYTDSSKAVSELANKMQALGTVLDPVINLFKAMGEEDSILGQIAGGASNAFSAAANVSGGLSALGLGAAGPYGAAAAAALSVGSSLIKAFGADYSEYNKAKAQYENLASIWDSLISKKTEYMNIHWGTEATEASKEAQEMLKAEIEQTRIIAQKRLVSGTSAGSHSIGYRMWKGSYDYEGKNWRDVAGQISSKYGVQFNGMEDLLNMDADTLSKIKKEHIGLWSSMDSDFRDYLEKLIEYGEKADDMIEALTEKLTGNKFSDLVSSWGDAMSTMANSSDNLVDHFEENLKKTILSSMIENIYGDKIKALIEKTKKYAENGDKITDGNGSTVSEYTASEYADIKGSTDDLAKQIEATREYLRKTYGWSDNSSSSSRNSVKSITEETGDLIASYLNSIRLDASVLRDISNKYYSEMSEIAKSQLTQLNMIAQYTQRNAEAAEKIETTVYELNSNFNRVISGTKQVHVK